jgi:hypothetical protein
MEAAPEGSAAKAESTAKRTATSESASAAECAPAVKPTATAESASAVKPTATVEPASAVKPTATVEPAAPAVKAASSSVKSSTAMPATLRESRLRRAEKQEREDCQKNYGKGLLHFSPSDTRTRTARREQNFRISPLSGRSNNNYILHLCRALNEVVWAARPSAKDRRGPTNHGQPLLYKP